MALVRVRHASLSIDGKKVAEMYNNKHSINSGDEMQFGDEGMIGFTDGAVTSTVDMTAIVPVAGMSVTVEDALLQKRDVDITLYKINGRIHQFTTRCTKAEYDSDAKAGSLVGSFTFGGGVPSTI